MRVITHLGLGKTNSLESEPVVVLLDAPFLENREQYMSNREVFHFTNWGIIRVLNVSGTGLISNLQFHPSERDAEKRFLNLCVPPDETHFLFNLTDGSARSSQPMGFATEDFLTMRPWIDRWAPERSSMFEERQEALNAFQDEKEHIAGSTGISSTVLFSTQDGKLLWFYISIAPPQGIIFEQRFTGATILNAPGPALPPS